MFYTRKRSLYRTYDENGHDSLAGVLIYTSAVTYKVYTGSHDIIIGVYKLLISELADDNISATHAPDISRKTCTIHSNVCVSFIQEYY